jgi:hypothetical protein
MCHYRREIKTPLIGHRTCDCRSEIQHVDVTSEQQDAKRVFAYEALMMESKLGIDLVVPLAQAALVTDSFFGTQWRYCFQS